jgi:hypothetical protein
MYASLFYRKIFSQSFTYILSQVAADMHIRLRPLDTAACFGDDVKIITSKTIAIFCLSRASICWCVDSPLKPAHALLLL